MIVRRKPAGVLLLAAMLMGLLLGGCAGQQQPSSGAEAEAPASETSEAAEGQEIKTRPMPGYKAPDLSGRDVVTGKEIRLSDLKGQAVLLNFWATWCGPCQDEMPEMEAFHKEYGDKIRVLAVGADKTDSPEKMAAFGRDYQLTFPLVHNNGESARAFRALSIPTTLVIDGEGIVRYRITGPMTLADMKQLASEMGVAVE